MAGAKTLTEIAKKHNACDTKPAVCLKYPGNPTRTDIMCKARHLKAVQDPEGITYTFCRDCEIGREASLQPVKSKSSVATFKTTKVATHLCLNCGAQTRDKLCAACKIAAQVKKKEEGIMVVKCKAEDCKNLPVFSKGYCRKCYDRIRRARIKNQGLKTAAASIQKAKRELFKKDNASKIQVRPALPQAVIKPKPDYPLTFVPNAPVTGPKEESNHIAYLAQLLYCSQLIEIEIKNSLESDKINLAGIADIRFRLGEILMGRLQG